jgi:hypothetical protein
VNGPRGGFDQRCRIEASVVPSGRMTAHATEPEAAAALSRASARIARRVKGELDRRHTRQKRRQARRAEQVGVWQGSNSISTGCSHETATQRNPTNARGANR